MITVIGDLCVDIQVNKNETNYATDTEGKIEFTPGGQANNVAAWIAEEGVKCQLIGRVGDDPFGQYLVNLLKKQGIIGNIYFDENQQTGKILVIIDDATKNRSMVVDRGANLKLSVSQIKGIESSNLLYISGYSLFDENIKEAIYHAKEVAISNNIPIAIDPSSTYFLKEHKEEFIKFLSNITFMFPNYEEGCLLTNETEPSKIMRKLKELVPHPILKLGSEGCMLYDDNNELIHLPAKQVDVIDTTGAGDSFIGTFLANYEKTNNKLQSAKKAIDNASKVVTKFGSWPYLK